MSIIYIFPTSSLFSSLNCAQFHIFLRLFLSDVKYIALANSELIKQLSQDERERLVPNIAVFKEIMVELLKVQKIDITSMRIERAEFIQEETKDFRLQSMLLDILDKRAQWQKVKKLIVHRLPEANPVLLKQLDENTGVLKNIRCSDVMLKAVWE